MTNREGGLRFTSRDDAMVELDSGGIAIVPGDPIAGSLVARITSRRRSGDDAAGRGSIDS